MKTPVARFQFKPEIDLEDAEDTLHLSIYAAEGLFSPAAIRLAFKYERIPDRRIFYTRIGSPEADAVTKIFASLAMQEFGTSAFTLSMP